MTGETSATPPPIERPPNEGYDVFLCHRRSDGASTARWLKEWLRRYRLPEDFAADSATVVRPTEARPLAVFLDRDVEGASHDYWAGHVRPSLEASRKVIVLWTPDASRRRPEGTWDAMWEEIDHLVRAGREADIVLVPIGVDPLGPCPGHLTTHYPRMERRTPFRALPGRPWKLVGWRADGGELSRIAAAVCHVPQSSLPELLGIDRQRELRRMRARLAITASALVMIAGLLIATLVFYRASEHAREVNLVRLLSAQAQGLLDGGKNQLELAGLLAAEAARRAIHLDERSAETTDVLRTATELLAPMTARARVRPRTPLALDREGRLAVVAAPDRGVALMRLPTLEITHRLDLDAGLSTALLDPSSSRLVLADAEGRVVIRAVPEMTPVADLRLDWKYPKLSLTADGRVLAITGGDGARLIDPASGNTLATLPQASWGYTAVAIDPGGRFLVTANGQDAVVWTVARLHSAGIALQKSRTLPHAVSISDLMVSADGGRLAVLSGREVVVWSTADWGSGQTIRHLDTVSAAAFDPSASRIASGDTEGTVLLTDLGPQGSVRALRHRGGIRSLHFRADGRRIVSAGDDATARVWDTDTGRELTRMVHDSWVTAARFTSAGEAVVTASVDGYLSVFRPLPRPAGLTRIAGAIAQISFLPTDAHLLLAGHAGAALVPVRGEVDHPPLLARPSLREPVSFAALPSAGDALLAVAGAGGPAPGPSLQLWDLAGGRIRRSFAQEGLSLVAIDRNGRIIIAATRQHSINGRLVGRDGVVVRRLADGAVVFESSHPGVITSLAVTPDASRLAVTSSARAPRASGAAAGQDLTTLWALETRAPIRALAHDRAPAQAVFLPRPAWLAVATGDTDLLMLDAKTGESRPPLRHDAGVVRLAVSGDDRYLITATARHDVHLWTLPALVRARTLPHDGRVTALAFHDGQQLLVTGTERGTVNVYAAASGRLLAQLILDRPVLAVAISRDGRLLATAQQDPSATGGVVATVVETWPWTPEDLLAETCGRLSRPLTDVEVAHYLNGLPREHACPRSPGRGRTGPR